MPPRATCAPSMMDRYPRSEAMVRSMASSRKCRDVSTPSPSLVIRISRATTDPAPSTTSNRVEFVPQSIAAHGAHVGHGHGCITQQQRPFLRLPRNSRRCATHIADGVLPAGQPPRNVGMQALDALPGPSHSPTGAWPVPTSRESTHRARPHTDGARRPGPSPPPAPRPAGPRPPPRAGRPGLATRGSTSQ